MSVPSGYITWDPWRFTWLKLQVLTTSTGRVFRRSGSRYTRQGSLLTALGLKAFSVGFFKAVPLHLHFWSSSSLDAGGSLDFSLPSNIAPGEYLLRAELISLQNAVSIGGAEFYPVCSQIRIGGSGTGAPQPNELVEFPGAYNPTDPGIHIDVYTNPDAPYIFPGPPVASFVTSGASSDDSPSGYPSGDSSTTADSIATTSGWSSYTPPSTGSPTVAPTATTTGWTSSYPSSPPSSETCPDDSSSSPVLPPSYSSSPPAIETCSDDSQSNTVLPPSSTAYKMFVRSRHFRRPNRRGA